MMDDELVRDLTDAALWLEHQSGESGCILIAQQPSQLRREITYAVVLSADARLAQNLQPALHAALKSLGWRFVLQSSTAPVSMSPRVRNRSAHERLAAVARVERALASSPPF